MSRLGVLEVDVGISVHARVGALAEAENRSASNMAARLIVEALEARDALVDKTPDSPCLNCGLGFDGYSHGKDCPRRRGPKPRKAGA